MPQRATSCRVGLDLGSVYTKAVLLDPRGGGVVELYRRKARDDASALEAFLDDVGRRAPEHRLTLGITGGSLAAEPGGLAVVLNGILAVAAGVGATHHGARCALEVGGHTSKSIVLGAGGGVREFATNEACAAGTGSFLEQQARRLGWTARDLSELAGGAARAATIAGRCSVFAASDMIHLQQKGTPLPEIAYGLCAAIARNCLSTLLKGRAVRTPVVLAGGCARSRGIVRAFREVLGLQGDQQLVVSAHPGLEGAIGAAILARDGGAPELALSDVRRLVAALLAASAARPTCLPRLRPAAGRIAPAEPEGGLDGTTECYLGADVGSVSTDLVLLDAKGELLSSIYLPTRGRPAEALLQGLAALRERCGGMLSVLGCGATGSGRHLAAKLIHADVVKNEITCQLLGAQRYVPDVDTIFEIGGQDSKFVSVRGGVLADFAMNKVCAAGTGSFLEEQSRGLGIDVCRDFAPRAFAAAAPLDLGSRCTVFMETEVVGTLGSGAPVAEICAGLAYSIARNYLDKVVGTRPLGRRIVFQGGVASNAAVVAAFESILGRPVHVHPYNRISGAIGAALAAKAAREAAGGAPSRFTLPPPGESPSVSSFECRLCSNRCEVNVLETGRRGERAFFGDTCERYTSGSASRASRVPNLAEEYLERCEALYGGEGGSGLAIGVPRAGSLLGALPFWATFWRELGHRPVLSPASSQETLALGLKHLSVGVCLPVKLMAGHVHALLAAGTDLVFVPSVVILPGDDATRSYSCPYTMAVPFMVDTGQEERILAPVVSFESEDAFLEGFQPYLAVLGVSSGRLREAFRAALLAQRSLDERFTRRAGEAMAEGRHRHVFAVLGRPYSTFDSYLNMGVLERLRRLDVLGVPMAFLPRPPCGAGPRSELPWRYPVDIHEAAMGVSASEGLQPVVLTSFGCGPDAFTLRRVEEALGGRPHLVLELDEHRGEAGLITRLEAFLDQLGWAAPPRRPSRVRVREGAFLPPASSRVVIPYFADHAYAFSGLFRMQGHDTRLLPLPGREVRALGERYSLGKECHAYAMIAGDLLELAGQAGAGEAVFFFPGTSIPCLLHEYGWGMQALLDELGLEGVRVSSPNTRDLIAAYGIDAMERLYMGLLAIELLVKAVCQTRPYELRRGLTDDVHRRNLERIEAAVAGGDVLAALGVSLEELTHVPVEAAGERPIVGLAGDVYTKVNPAANDDLVRWLEEKGLEVWPSPFQVDILDFGISRRLYKSVASLDLQGLLVHGSVALRRAVDVWRMRSVVGTRVTRSEEPGYLELRRLAAPYMPNEAHELLFLNVAKIVEFAQGGADGVVNAICFGCMVGNASAAVIERIRRDYGDLPMVTAVYAGADDPARRMVLEAFVSQVEAHHRRRRAAEDAPARGWLRLVG